MTKGGNLPNPSVAKGINLQPPDLIFTADIKHTREILYVQKKSCNPKKSLAPNTRAQILPNTQDPDSTSFLLILIT